MVLDGRHLRQVLLNLLGNAIKFTAQARVRLDVGALDGDRLLFEVTRSPASASSRRRSGRSSKRLRRRKPAPRAGGTGLGLAISHQLVRRMGGDLRVESTLGPRQPLLLRADSGAGGRRRVARRRRS